MASGWLEHERPQDVIRVDNLTLMVPFTDGARWPAKTRPTMQPVQVSLTIPHDLRPTAETDDLVYSIDYSAIPPLLVNNCSAPVDSLESLAERIFGLVFDAKSEIQDLGVRIIRPKALLHAESVGIDVVRNRDAGPGSGKLFIKNFECAVIVGINPCEREEKQRIRLNISIDGGARRNASFPFKKTAKHVLEYVQSSSFLTIEALVSGVAHAVLSNTEDDGKRVIVRLSKPSALVLADAAEVEVSRTLKDYMSIPADSAQISNGQARSEAVESSKTPSLSSLLALLPQDSTAQTSLPHRAAIALGSNLGDRFANVEVALRMLESTSFSGTGTSRVQVIDTSFMYETAPMYVENQPRFINCACMVETDLSPRELLTFLKEIESAVGRVTSFRNGPRAIDLDILTYDSLTFDSRPEHARNALDNLENELVIPHPRLSEREFVLRPLNDMIPAFMHPVLHKPIGALLTRLLSAQPADTPPMFKVTPFPQYPSPSSIDDKTGISMPPPTLTYWSFPVPNSQSRPRPRHKTRIMATLNATPDSFSDGSQHDSVPAGLAYAASSIENGADIIDIGGYSTRPHASFVSPSEELERVVPIIQAIRSSSSSGSPNQQFADVLISVDTFRDDVASAAVNAGANCVNDVYGFTGHEYPLTLSAAEHFMRMRAIIRALAVPVIMMHSRGEASANKDYSAYAYAADADGRGAVLEGVRVELGEKVEAAIKGRGGLRRWQVIVDPGIGFSKTPEGNLELLRDASAMISERDVLNALRGFPQLIGPSRKSFLGLILERPDEHGALVPGHKTRPDERVWATGAVVSCAVQQKACVVRVHDVPEMRDVVVLASALWS